MNKIYLFLIFLLFLQIKAQSVIFSQPHIGDYGSAFASYTTTNGDLIGPASSFILNQTSTITKINIFGHQSQLNLNSLSNGFILYIYNDNNGVPAGQPILQTGTPVAAINVTNSIQGYTLVNTSNTSYVYSIDIPALAGSVILQANTKYWLFFVAKLNINSIDISSPLKFNWWGGSDGTPGFMRISNLTGAPGYPTWTIYPYNGCAFTIEGSTLGTDEIVFDSTNIKVYPNPTSDYIHIDTKDKIKQIALYDVSGKKISATLNNNNIDLRGLPTGSYFLSLETERGTVVKKIIKK
ncbi:MAG: T9SS type A sorting domain-containing protein [Candidatus Chryseobacterium colombiense]|nr:T9SS type A sorting domain-containing protein [Chryseobacterium sp.]WEK69510.1 MAG: T9SS type A sorting domain-containing protein [Chryseobacterium sp.]